MSNIKHNESGATMLFVLGIMLLLMAIGISALTAAGANAGAGLNQRLHNQLNLYADSVQKSIMYSLQSSGADTGRRVDNDLMNVIPPMTLGGQLIRSLYLHGSQGIELPFVLDIKLDGASVPVEASVSFTLEPGWISITEFKPYIPEVPDIPETLIDEYRPAVPAQARSAGIRAEVDFTVRTEQNGKSVIYSAVYQLSGVGIIMSGYTADMIVENPAMEIYDAGTWRIKSYERIEN